MELCFVIVDYVFSCMDKAFLELNFEPIISRVMPWAYMTNKSGITHSLSGRLARGRAAGVAISQLAQHRNQATAAK
jgi:hypothetical protein